MNPLPQKGLPQDHDFALRKRGVVIESFANTVRFYSTVFSSSWRQIETSVYIHPGSWNNLFD